MSKTKAFAAFDRTSALGPWELERREPTARDVEFDILFCGGCHSDMHTGRSEGRVRFTRSCPGTRSSAR
jgi:uncharacterized zinc-type alcohol dehydrogenase-like protein